MRLSSLVVIVFAFSCSTPQQSIFSKRSPHEQYSANLLDARLKRTALGQSWFNAALKALQQPLSVSLPYQENGYFSADDPEAQGYRFAARRGEQVIINYTKNTSREFTLFLDLWDNVENGSPRLLADSDTSSTILQYEVKKDGNFILRLQPELLASLDYTLTIKTAPSLGFPVAVAHNPRIGSFWGDQRNAGARSHEGLDIFGAFRTPVIAAADGEVSSVTTNRLGGKVVFMRPQGKNFALYYAHLDSQTVAAGQRVNMGDTLGLMGNTGNAKNTPTHLHFGIYAVGGAVDPLPFINRDRPEPAAIAASTLRLNQYARSNQAGAVLSKPEKNATKVAILQTNGVFRIKAAAGSWYKVQMPDEQMGFVASNLISTPSPLRTLTVSDKRNLLDRPDSSASSKISMDKGSKVAILGKFGNYYYAAINGQTGWLLNKETR